MASCCSVANCKNRRWRGAHVTFHRFPLTKESQLKKWIKNIGRPNFSPSYNDVVCSEHFKKTDFWGSVASGRRNLKPGAVPTIFNTSGRSKRLNVAKRPEKKSSKKESLVQHDPPNLEPSTPSEVGEGDAEVLSSKNDIVILEHSYSAPASPIASALDLRVASTGDQATAEPQGRKSLRLRQARTRREHLEEMSRNASEEPAANLEVQLRLFREYHYQEEEGPRYACCRLWDLCHQWLRPGRHTKLQMLELVILEQFQAILPQKMQDFVKEQGPSNCDHAVSLAEEFLKSQQEEEVSIIFLYLSVSQPWPL
ncbi:peroxynitrite isomerase THAP4-like isoform X2 [Candoia aspera]|uniref:peroxynitrite isomerase THAP4-like isoform X2 n=1 Tax=Candoia aspera TaxID=51853 RepID=UPI002FD86938